MISAEFIDPTVLHDRGGVAVKGYDVVAYFTQEKPVKGNSDISAEHEDVTYHFSSDDSRRAFLESPARYIPAYGGYCAYAVAMGKVAKIRADLWLVHGDRLFLNFSKGTQRKFVAELDEMIANADKNWPGIRAELEAHFKAKH